MRILPAVGSAGWLSLRAVSLSSCEVLTLNAILLRSYCAFDGSLDPHISKIVWKEIAVPLEGILKLVCGLIVSDCDACNTQDLNFA